MINFKAKKSLGQNFLKSDKALRQIIDVADPTGIDLILEIGPGKGALTERLLPFSGKIIAVEKDHRAIEFLEEKFSKEINSKKLEILEKDILEFDPNILKFYKDLNYKVIANIPYYITGEILRKFLSSTYHPQSMTLMVQKEVAERIISRDGKESILSISVKVFGKPKYVATVPKGAFNPAPSVDSAILHISEISHKIFEENKITEQRFFEVVKAGFAHKRKQLGSNLKNIVSEEQFLKCGIDMKTRAEELKVGDWVCLSKKS